MGILDPLVAADIDMYAATMLRDEDPDPMELFSMMMLGGGNSGQAGEEDEVWVDGVRR